METFRIRMHAEDVWVGLRTGLLDQNAGILLLEHLLALAEEMRPGGLASTHLGVQGERVSLEELQRRNRRGLLAPRATRETVSLLLGLLESSRPGCLRLLDLELEFTGAPSQPDGVRLQRLLVVHPLR